MNRNTLYCLIVLMGLSAACKKSTGDVKLADPVSATDPYKHARPIELAGEDGSLVKYSYNAASQVVKQEYFVKDNSSTKLFSSQTFVYTNGKVVQVILERGTSTKYITDYKYQGNTDLIESTVSNSIDYQNPAQPVTTSTIYNEFSYVGGKLSKVTGKDGMGVPFNISTYTFSMLGENPFVLINYVPQSVNGLPANPAFSATTEYYNNVIDPVSYFSSSSTSVSKFLPKNGTLSANTNTNFTQTYELDGSGKIKTLTTVYPATQSTIKTAYTYESY